MAFATTPLAFESEERHEKAEQGLKELETAANTVIHIPMSDTQRLFSEKIPSSAAFRHFDEFVVQSVRGLIGWVYYPSVVEDDFFDVKEMFRNGGRGYAAVGSGEGEGRVEQVLKNTLGEDKLLLGGFSLQAPYDAS